MSNRKGRKTYDKEFKKEAVRLVLEDGYSAAEVERNLGIGHNVVSRWIKEMTVDAKHAFPGKGRLKLPDEKIRALERELAKVKRERDILKKAVAIFSTDPDRYSDS
jgi:transposase